MSERPFLHQLGLWLAMLCALIVMDLALSKILGKQPDIAFMVASYALFRTFRWRKP